MQAVEKSYDIDAFFRKLARAPRRILMLDFDGTLAPFQDEPSTARFYPGVGERLDAIMEDPRTSMAIISGRWTRDLVPLLTLKRLPDIWGSHGWEQLRANGDYELPPLDEKVVKGLVEADEWGREIASLGGRCERKPGSLAVHWRGLAADRVAAIRRLVFDNWMDQGLHQHLMWHDFDGGVELRAPGKNKGHAVNTILAQFDHFTAAYLGDDITDEDAFRAINGRGLSALVRGEYRPTAAELWLRPPEELLQFLDRWQTACQGAS